MSKKNKIGLVFHGNGGNANGWSQAFKPFKKYLSKIYIHEYAGYGMFYNKPPIKQITRDLIVQEATKGLLYIKNLHPNATIILIGVSLGTGITCEIASKNQQIVAGVILITPYLSISDLFPAGLNIIVKLLLADNYSCKDYIGQLSNTIPICLIAGKYDKLTPCWHSEVLLSLCPNSKTSKLLSFNGSHNQAMSMSYQWLSDCFKHVNKFL